jgi:hypothetical protein
MRIEVIRGDRGGKRQGFSVHPETEFEADFLAQIFVGSTDRHVVVVSPMSDLGQVDYINVFVEDVNVQD